LKVVSIRLSSVDSTKRTGKDVSAIIPVGVAIVSRTVLDKLSDEAGAGAASLYAGAGAARAVLSAIGSAAMAVAFNDGDTIVSAAVGCATVSG